MRNRGPALPFALAAGAATACSALFSGPGDYPPRDAGSTAADAAVVGDAAALLGVRCNQITPTFCDDFDTDAPGWTDGAFGGAGKVQRATDRSTSSPSSIHATATPDATTEQASFLYRFITQLPQARHGTLSYDVLIDELGGSTAGVGNVAFKGTVASAPRDTVEIIVRKTGEIGVREFWLQDGQPTRTTEKGCGTVVEKGVWHHLALAVDLDGKKASMTLDGASPCAVDLQFTTPLAPDEVPVISVGVSGADPNPSPPTGWSVYEDSVVFDGQ